MSANAWTTGEDETLRELAIKNLSGSQIAAQLNRTRNSVIGRAHRLGIALGGALRPGGRALKAKKKAAYAGAEKVTRKAIKKLVEAELPNLIPEAFTPTCEPVPLTNLEEGMCKWPVGEGGMYCGGHAPLRKPYCAAHNRAGTQPPPQRGFRRTNYKHW